MTDPLENIGEPSYMPYFGLKFPQASVERLIQIYEILCQALAILEGEVSAVTLKKAEKYYETGVQQMIADPKGGIMRL